jgi:hypothetical protein
MEGVLKICINGRREYYDHAGAVQNVVAGRVYVRAHGTVYRGTASSVNVHRMLRRYHILPAG